MTHLTLRLGPRKSNLDQPPLNCPVAYASRLGGLTDAQPFVMIETIERLGVGELVASDALGRADTHVGEMGLRI